MIKNKNNQKKRGRRISDIVYDNQKPILDAIRMKLSPIATLAYLKNHGFPIRNVAYDRYKTDVLKNECERLIRISEIILEDNRILEEMELELIRLPEDYNNEKDCYKRAIILEKIIIINYYLDVYYRAMRGILMI